MARRGKSLVDMSFDVLRAAQDTAVTIAARLPAVAKAARNPGVLSRDMQEMVSEKIEAGMQGSMAAGKAFGHLWTRAMLGGIRTPMDAAKGMFNVADAAMTPALKRVRANAKRLSRAK